MINISNNNDKITMIDSRKNLRKSQNQMFNEYERMGIQYLLNYIAEISKLPTAMYYTDINEDAIWAENVTQMHFCEKVKEYLGKEICEKDHKTRAICKDEGDIKICHAGLHNFSIPITLNNYVIASIMSGQIILNNRIEESRSKFKDFIFNLHLNQNKKNILMELYESIPVKNEEIFRKHFEKIKKVKNTMLKSISERIKIEQDRDYFLLSRVHELISPVVSLKAASELLFQYYGDSEINQIEKKEWIDTLFNMSKYFSYIVERTEAAMSSGKDDFESLEFEEQNILDVYKESIEIFKWYAKEENIIFEEKRVFPRKMDEIFVKTSKESLQRAFNNIIHNAIKYSYEKKGENKRYVKFFIELTDKNIIFRIENYGPGILKEELDEKNEHNVYLLGNRGKMAKIFRPFGYGFGLGESKRIIENHNGTLNVLSVKTNPITMKENCPYITSTIINLPLSRKQIEKKLDYYIDIKK